MRDATEPAGSDVRIGARRLRVVRCGNGPVNVVFESGGGRGSDDWLPVQRLLPEVTSWSYDRAGEGASPGNGEWSLRESTRDLQAWLTAAGVARPVVLVGHSLGCHIVRAHVAAYPGGASAMLLVDARPPHFERTLLDAGVPVAVPPPETSIFKEITLADEQVSGFEAPAGVTAAAICCDRFDSAPGVFTGPETDEAARLWRAAQAGIARSIGQADVRIAPGTGHQVPTEAPAFVASAIREVIARQQERQGQGQRQGRAQARAQQPGGRG